jgi:hypothetical protein
MDVCAVGRIAGRSHQWVAPDSIQFACNTHALTLMSQPHDKLHDNSRSAQSQAASGCLLQRAHNFCCYRHHQTPRDINPGIASLTATRAHTHSCDSAWLTAQDVISTHHAQWLGALRAAREQAARFAAVSRAPAHLFTDECQSLNAPHLTRVHTTTEHVGLGSVRGTSRQNTSMVVVERMVHSGAHLEHSAVAAMAGPRQHGSR